MVGGRVAHTVAAVLMTTTSAMVMLGCAPSGSGRDAPVRTRGTGEGGEWSTETSDPGCDGTSTCSSSAESPVDRDPRPALTPYQPMTAAGGSDERKLQQSQEILSRVRPVVAYTDEFYQALQNLDDVTQQQDANQWPFVADFYTRRIEVAVTEIEQTRVTRGLVLWKLFNDGFVVRSPTVTLCFDVWWAWAGGAWGADRVGAFFQRVVAQCDILFVSHLHGDHHDPNVLRWAVQAGKPVWVPPNVPGLAGSGWFAPARSHDQAHSVTLANGHSLQVIVGPGYQSDPVVLNNVYFVTTPEGFHVAHTGDLHRLDDEFVSSRGMDFNFLKWVYPQAPVVDLLLFNAWTCRNDSQSGPAYCLRMVRNIPSKVAVVGHELEFMAHNPDKRRGYALARRELTPYEGDYLFLPWGTSFWYDP
jgi:L-ascorbate metabolism protein UlaG (beta-lactamase superfamily)